MRSIWHQNIDFEYEVIVIDNNSTDQTRLICLKIGSYFKNFTYYFEHKQGLSLCKNRGIDLANGNYIQFMDDDAWYPLGFFKQLNNINLDNKIGYCNFKQSFLNKYPNWIDNKWHQNIHPTIIDNKLTSGFIVSFCTFYPITLFNSTIKFDTNLGKNGNKMRYGEEIKLLNEIKNLQYKFIKVSELEIFHINKYLGFRKYLLMTYKLNFYNSISNSFTIYKKIKFALGSFINSMKNIWKYIISLKKTILVDAILYFVSSLGYLNSIFYFKNN